MTDLALVAAGVMAAMPQPDAPASVTYPAALRLQEDQLIGAVLNAPVMAQPRRTPWPEGAVPESSERAIAPQFSSLPAASPSTAPAAIRGTNPALNRRAQVEARLRQLEQSALAQTPGVMVSLALPLETMPLETMPLETMPLETMPLETMPLETMPLETMPLEQQPERIAPELTPAPSIPQPAWASPVPASAQTALKPPSFAPPQSYTAPLQSGPEIAVYRFASTGRVGDRIWNSRTRYSPMGHNSVRYTARRFR